MSEIRSCQHFASYARNSAAREKLFTAVLSDALDGAGCTTRAMLLSHAPDLAFCDADAVVVMPQVIEAEVFHIASEQINGEHHPMRTSPRRLSAERLRQVPRPLIERTP
jgi:hypothetical protein